jgi:hypothetical protein
MDFRTITNSCAEKLSTGVTPCSPADGVIVKFSTFEDHLAILLSSGSKSRQYFQYQQPGQRRWGVSIIYRTLPDGSGTLERVPNSWLDLHMEQQAEPLIDEQHSPYMGPSFNPNPSYEKCNTDVPLQY